LNTDQQEARNGGVEQAHHGALHREFLPTGDAALAEGFVSPDIVMCYPGQPEQRRWDTLLALVAANREAFPDLVWTPEQMAADGDTVAVRYTMTGTQQGSFAGVASTDKPVSRRRGRLESDGLRAMRRSRRVTSSAEL
jgi:SnoaL-like polyketide cyclase